MILNAILLIIMFILGLLGGAVMVNELWLIQYPEREKVQKTSKNQCP